MTGTSSITTTHEALIAELLGDVGRLHDEVQALPQALKDALGSDSDPVAERSAFAENYMPVSAVMSDDQKGAHSLVLAWREFQESMVDESTSPVRNTNRPAAFFNRAAPKLTMSASESSWSPNAL